MKLFEIRDLRFRRSPVFALNVRGFALEEGEKVAVVGPNGSGKTTLLRLLAQLERPDSWRVFSFRGHPVSRRFRVLGGIGFLRQEPLLFKGSVLENLAYPLRLRRVDPGERRRRLDSMLARMELVPLAGLPARDLSRGEQRRLALGRVLLMDPDILLLDEPIAHLDIRSRAVMEDILLGAGQTVLMTSHDLELAHRVAGRVVSLRSGQLSAGLSVNVLEGRIEDGDLVTDQGLRIPLPQGIVPPPEPAAKVVVDPRKIRVLAPGETPGDQPMVEGTVCSLRELGKDVWVEVDGGYRWTAILDHRRFLDHGVRLGQRVAITFGPQAVERF